MKGSQSLLSLGHTTGIISRKEEGVDPPYTLRTVMDLEKINLYMLLVLEIESRKVQTLMR